MIEDLRMPASDTLLIFHPFIALAFGTLVGLLAQSVAARLRHNGQWNKMSSGRKWALRWTGALAAYGIGLWVLDHPVPGRETPYVYRLWFYQLAAAWGGTAVLDAVLELLFRMLRERNRRGPGGVKGSENDDDD